MRHTRFVFTCSFKVAAVSQVVLNGFVRCSVRLLSHDAFGHDDGLLSTVQVRRRHKDATSIRAFTSFSFGVFSAHFSLECQGMDRARVEWRRMGRGDSWEYLPLPLPPHLCLCLYLYLHVYMYVYVYMHV